MNRGGGGKCAFPYLRAVVVVVGGGASGGEGDECMCDLVLHR